MKGAFTAFVTTNVAESVAPVPGSAAMMVVVPHLTAAQEERAPDPVR